MTTLGKSNVDNMLVGGGTKRVRQPSCPNDHQPKLDKIGRPIQCLPGSSSHSVCGDGHACFFSGMNYMCCPTNQSSGRHQHTCPAPMVTVLDSSGAPLRCKSWTRACPQEGSECVYPVSEERIRHTW
ncbi:hypothetical protein RB195_024912 [Necator americanus]|uniref:WAP domain-containing protein n=1 Tax=Necator americanus TaxID=51031 RepID=A0ABR1EQ28_NECAM